MLGHGCHQSSREYYFYFSRGNNELGVVEGDTPTGPWTDPLHRPLVASGSVDTKARDPAILQEDDGTTYLIFGCWDYYIARLNDDMVTLAETPRKVAIEGKTGPYGAGKTDDKSYLHKYNGKYYLSWGCFYAMSDNVYGPYVYKGCIITQARTEPAFQKDLVQDRHASSSSFTISGISSATTGVGRAPRRTTATPSSLTCIIWTTARSTPCSSIASASGSTTPVARLRRRTILTRTA